MADKMNVTAQNPCPICGKPDWCFFMPSKNGAIPLVYCARTHIETEVSGNGRNYCFIKHTNSFTVYADAEQEELAKQARIEAWKAEKKEKGEWKEYHSSKNKKPEKKSTSANFQPSTTYLDRTSYEVRYNLPTEDASVLNRVYRTFAKACGLSAEHRQLLVNEWGEEMMERVLKRVPIFSIPMPDSFRIAYGKYVEIPFRKRVIEEMMSNGITSDELSHTPFFYQLDNGTMTFLSNSGIGFPVFNTKGDIIRVRVREDFPKAKGVFWGKEGVFYAYRNGWYFKSSDSDPVLVYQPKGKVYKVQLDKNGVPLSDNGQKSKVSGKYKNCSSFKEMYDDEKKIIYNKYLNGTQSGSYPSLYFKNGDDFSMVIFTEGEKKAIIANEVLSIPCVSFPGVGTFVTAFEKRCDNISIVDFCIRMGMKKAVICYDADKKENANVLRQEQNCISFFKERRIQIAVGSWNEHFGKGLDDILLSGIRPTIHDCT